MEFSQLIKYQSTPNTPLMNTTVASVAYWIQPALQIFINIWFAKIFIINLIPVSNKTQLVYVAKMILVIVKKILQTAYNTLKMWEI